MPATNFNDDANLYFSQHMIDAVVDGHIAPVKDGAMEWLRLLSPGELAQLGKFLRQLIDSPQGEGHQDLVTLTLQLIHLETGSEELAISMDQIADGLQGLWAMCHLQIYVQQGYIKLHGRWRITEPDDQEHYASLTEQGYQIASRPGAPPFLQSLKDKTGDANWN